MTAAPALGLRARAGRRRRSRSARSRRARSCRREGTHVKASVAKDEAAPHCPKEQALSGPLSRIVDQKNISEKPCTTRKKPRIVVSWPYRFRPRRFQRSTSRRCTAVAALISKRSGTRSGPRQNRSGSSRSSTTAWNVTSTKSSPRRNASRCREAKERVAIESYFNGYTRLDREYGEPHEAYDIGPDIAADDPDVISGRSLFKPRRWPDLPGFRERLSEYYDRGREMIVQLHRAIAVDLGADVEYFTPCFTRMVNLRMLHYPPHPQGRGGWGIRPHTDFGNLTLLAQDNPGLELRTRDGSWLPTEVRTDALMCNIGDCLMRWSNDTYVSTPHRVLNNTGRARHSVALFGDVNGDAVVACLPCARAPIGPRSTSRSSSRSSRPSGFRRATTDGSHRSRRDASRRREPRATRRAVTRR